MNVVIRHELLKGLRENRSVSIDEMIHALKIDREEYIRYENSDNEVDQDFAERLARPLSYNWSVFLLKDQPKLLRATTDNRTFENTTSQLGKRTILAMEEATFILGFSQELPNKQGVKFPTFNNISDPEKLGSEVRKLSGISIEEQEKFKDESTAFSAWLKFVENNGIFVSQYNLDQEDRVRAFSLIENNQAIIVLNTNDQISARTFSLLHELGHIIRRSEGLCDLHSSKDKQVEVFCNMFAAGFLAPLEVVKKYIEESGEKQVLLNLDWHVSKIASKLKVSKLAIYRRLATVGLITNSKYMEMHNRYNFSKPSRPPKREGEKSKGGGNYYLISRQKNGEAYTKNVFEAYDYGHITPTEVSSALGVSVKNLGKYRSWPALPE
jgi:Zn-dependent peptidase ImmA (M78 family)/transcriptional regulator with XRE-family HTH domain